MKKQTYEQIQVWDPLVRIFHWGLVVCFMIAYLLEDELINLHVLVGSIVLGLLVFRLIWGVVGTKHSRFTDFIYPFKQVKQQLYDLIHCRASHYIGHTPAGGIMILLLLTGLLIVTISGLILYNLEVTTGPLAMLVQGISYDTGILIEDLHSLIADVLACLVLIHIAGILVESILLKQNLIKAMITGHKTKSLEEK